MPAGPVVVQQTLHLAADGIAEGLIGIGKLGRLEHAERIRRGAPQVQAQASGAGDVGHHPVEDEAVALIGVEAVVQERPEKPAALRRPERNRVAHGCCRARRRGILQPRRDVAQRHQAKPGDRHRARPERHLVGPARLEPARHRHHVPVQAPPLARQGLGPAEGTVAHGQRRRALVSGVAPEIGDRDVRRPIVRHEHRPDRLADARGRRHVDRHQVVLPADVELPADPDQGEAVAHQEAVAEVRRRLGILCAPAVEAGQDHLAAPVHDVDQCDAVAGRVGQRPQDVDIRRKGDLSARSGGNLVQIGHRPVPGMRRVQREVGRADDFFVARAVDRRASHDVDPQDLGAGARRRDEGDEQEQ